ncbi:MAG: hypothetical protein ABJB09_03765 [Verrucomicrobiota bacterium]
MKSNRTLSCFFSFALGATILLLLTNCTTPGSQSPSSALCQIKDDNGNAIPAIFTGTTSVTHRGHAANHVVEVQKVETICCAGFDRIVVTCDGFHHPTYTVKYVPAPIEECGSGNAVPVAGNARLQVSLKPAQAHTDAGQPTITDRNRHLYCPNLKHFVLPCDFESDVQLVFGLNAKKSYRVVELQNPTRLVIDVKH